MKRCILLKIASLTICVLLLCSSGCMTVRDDRFVATTTPLSLKDARAFVGINGERERLRRNPFFVWNRQISPYTVFIQVYVFDDKYETVTVESPTLRNDGGGEIRVAPWRATAEPFREAPDGCKFQGEHPAAKPRDATCMLKTDAALSYDTNTVLGFSAILLLKTNDGGEQRVPLAASIRPYRFESSGSWWQCFRLILGGGM